jgi:hypothetical protein
VSDRQGDDVKGRLWRKLFKEVVESSQPSAKVKSGASWRSKLEEDPKLESRALNLNSTSVILHNTLQKRGGIVATNLSFLALAPNRNKNRSEALT